MHIIIKEVIRYFVSTQHLEKSKDNNSFIVLSFLYQISTRKKKTSKDLILPDWHVICFV